MISSAHARPPAQLFTNGADGTRLYVRTRPATSPSPGVTSLLTDGIACDGFIWKYLWDDLAAVTDVVHWHYRGHGRSGIPADPRAIELADHAHDLDAVRRAVGDPDVVIFGHSMGCQVSLEGFRVRRERVRGIVLVCGSYGRVTHTFKDTDLLAQLLPRLIERVEQHPEIARALWSRMPPEVALKMAFALGEVDAALNPLDLLPYMKHMVDIDLGMFLRMLRSAGEHTARDLLGQIDVPVLVIAGERDTFTPPRYAEEMAAVIPSAELLLVRGGTHVVPLEQRDLVRDRVTSFLRDRVLR